MILYSEENVGVTALLNYYVGATPGKKRKLSNEGKKRNKRNTSPGACRENLWVNGNEEEHKMKCTLCLKF
jgi:hypothetical protein